MSIRLRRTVPGFPRRALVLALGVAALAGPPACLEVRGQEPGAPAVVTLDQLLHMGPEQLCAVYQQGAAVALPAGHIRGTAIVAPGTSHAPALSHGSRLIWQGKKIKADQSSAINRFFGVPFIRGQLYCGDSWLDGRPAMILDYFQTSHVYAHYRDEIRMVGPGLFLGLMHDRTTAPPKVAMYFALEVRP